MDEMDSSRVVLAGSEQKAIPDAKIIGPADLTEKIQVTIVVRRRQELPPIGRSIMEHEELVANHGATAMDVLAVRDFATQYKLQVLAESAANRTVSLAGTVGDFSRAFEVKLDEVQLGNQTFRQRVGSITIPKELAGVIETVQGLDNLRAAEAK
jgi:kumamolisin